MIKDKQKRKVTGIERKQDFSEKLVNFE